MSFSLLKHVSLMTILGEQTGGSKLNLLQICNFISALLTIAITIMDTGIDYNLNEIQFYRNPLVQMIGVFCIAYSSTDGNMTLTLILCALWFFIKYRFNFYKFLNQEDPEDAYKTTVKYLLRRLKATSKSSNTYLN